MKAASVGGSPVRDNPRLAHSRERHVPKRSRLCDHPSFIPILTIASRIAFDSNRVRIVSRVFPGTSSSNVTVCIKSNSGFFDLSRSGIIMSHHESGCPDKSIDITIRSGFTISR